MGEGTGFRTLNSVIRELRILYRLLITKKF